ncbi:nuclease-related domain-containing protein [Streptomyces sp. NPDC048297]|uniref:nuclease-related domain-containing protein n=1 Tax=Streptomyces sp. NPDC048297 TaxID=3365531 RepID=UPI0037176661
MSGLRVVPTWRHGRERLYVCDLGGRNLAWYDRDTGRVNLIDEAHREDVLKALKAFVAGPVTVGPPPVPTPAELARLTLHPDDDLAPNRPGEALLVALDRDLDRDLDHTLALDPARAHRHLPRLRPDPRRRALTAEQTIGEALDRLEGAGWHTLHSVPLPGGDRIHHLLIGPAGLFVVHALYAHKQRVLVADPMITVARRAPEPLLRLLRSTADRASYALTAEVRPVLALAGPADLRVTAAPRSVRIMQDTDLEELARLGGILKPGDVEALHAMARDRNTWGRV